MSGILLGHAGKRRVEVDLDLLLRTRLLVQANSGGGKSWLIRRLAEQLFGKIPVLILDPEGEFATLREQYGYVLVGKGGETPADTRSAALVAQRLLELRASAVCDLYEMKPLDRHRWVRLFLEALIDAPKSLWRPTVVMVDEAHMFCPEKGAGESEARDAMISLPTRGRKRRFCAVWATQRLAKIDKDASAELHNRLIGPTFEDVDLKRAADLLSIRKEDRRAFDKEMRVLEPGNFYALGRAITKERILVQVGPVQTSHEIQDSKHGFEPPPPPEKVKALLPKLSDLPKQAEERARTEAELRTEIRSLKGVIAQAQKAQPAAAADPHLPGVLKGLKGAVEDAVKFIIQINAQDFFAQAGDSVDAAAIQKAIDGAVQTSLRLLEGKMQDRHREFDRLRKEAGRILKRLQAAMGGDVEVQVDVRHNRPFTVAPTPVRREQPHRASRPDGIGKGELCILTAVAQYPEGATREQLTILTGYRRSSRDTYLQRLRQAGLVEEGGGILRATEAGGDALGPDFEPLPTGRELLEHWLARLPKGEGEILRVAVEAYPKGVDREVLSEKTGYKRSSRDTYLQRLQGRRLVVIASGEVRAVEALFD